MAKDNPLPNGAKKWYHSKTFWTNAIAIVGILLASYKGIQISATQTAEILGFINLFLRAITNKGIY